MKNCFRYWSQSSKLPVKKYSLMMSSAAKKSTSRSFWSILIRDHTVSSIDAYKLQQQTKQQTTSIVAYLTHCKLGKVFHAFLSSADFFSISILSFRNTIRVSNKMDPDQPDILSGLVWIQLTVKLKS